MNHKLALLGLGIMFFVPVPAHTQVTTGTISGAITDSTEAVLPGVRVTILNADTGISRTIQTDAGGRYSAPSLSLGNYKVTASLEGFQAEVRSGIVLTVGREAVVDFQLAVGSVTQSVEVTGEASLVDTTTSAVTGLVEGKAILEMPLNGRSFTQLATLQPGVVSAPYAGTSIRGGAGGKISISGTRPDYSSFLLDGLDINDDVSKTPGSIAGILLGVETVQEFTTITNSFSAEFGRAAGGIVNAVTKAGTNTFHGTLFEFLRNSDLDARNFFDVGAPPPFKRNQFGAVVGGPIRKDKTFFFFGYEGLRQRLATTTPNFVPDLNARAGLLPDRTGALASVGVATAVRPYVNLYPLPNGPNHGGGVAEFIDAVSTATNENFYQIRTDHTFSSADSLFFRYTIDSADINAPDPLLVTKGLLNSSRNQYISLGETRIFSPIWLNVFRLGFMRSSPAQLSTASQPPEISFVPGRPMGALIINGLTTLGTNQQPEQLFGMQKWEMSDTVSRSSGRTSLSAGFQGEWLQQFGYTRTRINGSFQFQGLSNLLANTPQLFEAALPGTTFERSGRQWLLGFFVQDNYKLRPNLTLNLGIRYEFVTVPSEKHGRMSNLRHILDPAVTVGPMFANPSLKNFAPRVGFAWDVFSNGKTSVKGGYGIFDQQALSQVWRDGVDQNPPFFQYGHVTPVSGSQFPHPNLAALGSVAVQTFDVQYDLSQPYVMQYNLMIERELPGNTVLSAGYVGNRGVHLSRLFNNTAIPVILADGTPFIPAGSPRRNPNFSDARFKMFDANSNYNSLQASLKKRLSHGMMFQLSYTYSKFIDEQSGDAGSADFNSSSAFTMNPDNLKQDRGLSAYDVRNNLTFNYAYMLPFGPGNSTGGSSNGFLGKLREGWQINGIVSVANGVPITVGELVNRSQNGATGSALIADRPNLAPGASNNPVLGGANRYYDPTAFLLQPAGFFGNLGRNTLIGPGRATVDFSLIKVTSLGEKKGLQFRAEVFNLFNRVNLGLPYPDVFIDNSGSRSPTAGVISSIIGTSRQIQFGLKFTF